MPCLKGFRFPHEITAYPVWAYHPVAPSTPDVEDLLAERGVIVSRETVRQWVNRFGVYFANCIGRDRMSANAYRKARFNTFNLWHGYAREMNA